MGKIRFNMLKGWHCFFFGILLLPSCNNSKNENSGNFFAEVKVNLREVNQLLLQNLDTTSQMGPYYRSTDSLQLGEEFRVIYQAKEVIWFTEKGLKEQVQQLLEATAELQYDGLDTASYELGQLKLLKDSIDRNERVLAHDVLRMDTKLTYLFLRVIRDILLGRGNNFNKEIKNPNDSSIQLAAIFKGAVQSGKLGKAIDLLRPQHPWYFKFREEYKRLCKLKLQGGWRGLSMRSDSLRMGDSLSEIVFLRRRLFSEIGIPKDTNSPVWNQDVLESLKYFQFTHQLKQTARVDTFTLRKLNEGVDSRLKVLALNMERMRWLKRDFKQPYIWVAIPKMEMDYLDHDKVQFNMRVVIGRPSRPTPALDAKIENVVFSPPWIVPPTIMREEVVPGIARRGGAYLARRGLRAYDRRGRVVSASAINAGNYRKFSIGQAPGYRSSLGEVKFNMPNPWSIYMHDTPHREDFVKSYRAFSSGCVRVHKPKEFAVFLLQDSVLYSMPKVDSICKLRKTIFVPIKRNIDVHFVYLTTALDSAGNVMYLKDVYKWD